MAPLLGGGGRCNSVEIPGALPCPFVPPETTTILNCLKVLPTESDTLFLPTSLLLRHYLFFNLLEWGVGVGTPDRPCRSILIKNC